LSAAEKQRYQSMRLAAFSTPGFGAVIRTALEILYRLCRPHPDREGKMLYDQNEVVPGTRLGAPARLIFDGDRDNDNEATRAERLHNWAEREKEKMPSVSDTDTPARPAAAPGELVPPPGPNGKPKTRRRVLPKPAKPRPPAKGRSKPKAAAKPKVMPCKTKK